MRTALLIIVLASLAACSSGGAGSPDGSTKPDSGDAGHDDAATEPHDAAVPSPDLSPLGPEVSGQATYYDADGTGACGYPATTDYYVAAMNMAMYEKAICGECVQVTGPDGVVVVRITDDCPGCSTGGLDLSETAFSAISPLSAGRVDITWHVVACP